MLKPFQIRDLHVSPSSGHEVNSDPPVSQGVVQISATDYDDIASNYPRARLTYMDYDDGDQITVGSSLELSERLDEPIDISQRLDSVNISQDEPEPMHIFDIRRSNSVTELWKQFENTANKAPTAEMKSDVPATAEPAANSIKPEGSSVSEHIASPPSTVEEDSQPLMAAFEAELANILEAAETSDTQTQGTRSEPTIEPSASAGSQRIHPSVERFVAQMLQQLCSGVDVMQTELRTRIPELRRQLSEAQRDLPENLTTSLQALFAQLEVQMRAAFNNLPDNGRHMAEEAVQAGRPVAENAVESLRAFATNLDQSTRTLFAAFENEFGRGGSQNTSTTSGSSNAAPGFFCPPPNNATAPSVPNCQEGQAYPVGTTQQKDTTASGQPTVKDPKPPSPPSSQRAHPNLHVEQEPRPWERLPPRQPRHWQPPPFHPPHLPHPPSLAQPPSWPSLNDGQQWHQFGHPPNSLGRFAPPPPGPFSFPQWFQSPSTPSYPPANMRQPGSGILQYRTPAPPPYTASTQPRDGSMRTEAPENKTLFIGNVGFNVTENMIQDVFASKGFIVDVDLPPDSMSGKHAGFGYLHFPSMHPAMAAMSALQGFHVDGHAINLEFSDQIPIERIPSSQPSSEAANSSSPSSQQGSSQTAPVSGASSSQDKTLGKERIVPGGTARRNSSGSIKRRKSVTFREPVLSYFTEARRGDANKDFNAPRAASPALIDLTDESTAGVPPVWADSHSPPLKQGQPLTDKEMIDIQMDRFPPVSQLDAHLRANQRQGRSSVPPHGVSPEDYAFFRSRVPSHPSPEVPLKGATFGSNIQEMQVPTDVASRPKRHDFEKKDDIENSRSGSKPLPPVKRSDTVNVTPFNEASLTHSIAGVPLRRRATERNSLRPSARQSAEIDTWARLDRRERLHSRPSSTQSIPGSFPVEEVSQSPVTNASLGNTDGAQDIRSDSIDSCVSSLVDMGYGTPQEGGRSRMAVYAAASNGSLLDAIEMIEEERKAYAGQHRQ
ncbi:uncharacterized protein N7498_003481 [Penicillium cinerascens]|uniref:RRM domain-containing protein n=1 Tax=Penicillium cinerascens TaxID=70096 RepID=A0A9W9T7X8_9EURO|nr:uncharacterized protein N7498_003481 [Penicillium cinerascens]KAJ5211835.1 hypothetical protein N7498_003481 [Penicillium cinerascens]